MFIPENDLFYTTSKVNRLSLNRKEPDWINRQIVSENARFILLHNTRNLFLNENNLYQPAVLSHTQIANFLKDQHPWAFLGEYEQTSQFVIDLSRLSEQEILSSLSQPYIFNDLRQAKPISNPEQAALFAYGRGLMFWHTRHQFCGVCGSQTIIEEAGHVRRCLNPDCALEHFPRTDPCVIMLVHKDDKCLLAHHGRLKNNTYSTLAGFVEPGETLEHAVRREVMEEAGIKIGEVRYAGSQPWPFPTSLMMGFYAQAETTDISLDDDELLDAQWFSRDDLRNFNVKGRSLSSRDSIARCLIEGWLNA